MSTNFFTLKCLKTMSNTYKITLEFIHKIICHNLVVVLDLLVVKLFYLTFLAKEPWVVNGMIEYYAQTNSIRIVDVLVKVQIPHDKYIFDKLEKYLHVDSSQKVTALTLFGYIVRKHPTWLYKVVGHSFFKILLKLLKVHIVLIFEIVDLILFLFFY